MGGNIVKKNAPLTVDGNMKIANAEDELAVARGSVTGLAFVHKFGSAPDFDTTDGVVTMWDGADDAETEITAMTYTYSATADIDSISSMNAGDGQDIEVQGLDTNWDLVTQTITLSGLTRVPLTTNLIRVFRMLNVGSTDNAGHVVCYVNGADAAPVDGAPDDNTLIRAVIQPGLNQTLMSVYSIPRNVTGYLDSIFASLAGANKSSDYIVDLYVRPFGQVFQIKHRGSISDGGTGSMSHVFKIPEPVLAKSDIEMRVSANTVAVTGASISGGFDLRCEDD